MPSNELKQRKKNASQKQNSDSSDGARQNGEPETKKGDAPAQQSLPQTKSSQCFPELRTILCLLCVPACVALTWVVMLQNERLEEVEKNYNLLYGRTVTYTELEKRVDRVSEKLDASKDLLEGALSSVPTAARLMSDVASLRSVVAAMQASEENDDSATSSSPRGIQEVNARFLNVTEAWQSGLASVTSDLTALREESRSSHVRATENVNAAERRLRGLSERLEELEDSTRRNARVFERTEEEDVQQAKRQLDWTTARVSDLDHQLAQLARTDQELRDRLDEHEPRAQQCQQHLPAVEEAVRSILKLATGMAAVERRLEDLGLQVLGLEDSMLRALTQTVGIRQALDALGSPSQGTSAGSEIDAMLEALREMDMESESEGHVEVEVESKTRMEGEVEMKMESKSEGDMELEMESKRMMEEDVEVETLEERKEGDDGTVMEGVTTEEPEDKYNQEEELPEAEVVNPESIMTVQKQLQHQEEELPASQSSDVNV
ncbi:hypothetical protein ACEWY4_027526 [Coilia grayii]|uniref:Inhibitor of nuclear factor kappa-B kinase-interacting protein-like n=1 Tax=Coilia grayii TaxID=363190 RepID=A0ABD1IPX2_9TELE